MNLKVKNFTDYLTDLKLLENDILLLSSINKNSYNPKIQTVLIQMKELEKDYLVVSKPQSINAFSQKAKSFSWNDIEKKSTVLRADCESDYFSIDKCSKSIFDLQKYVLESSLSDAHIDSVVDELEYYKLQQQKVSYFNNEFQEKFDKNIEILNSELASLASNNSEINQISSDQIKFKLQPKAKKTEKVILENSILKDFSFKNEVFNLGICLFIFMFLVVKGVRIIQERILLKKLRKNYLKTLASIQKTARVRVRSFGKIQKKSLSSFSSFFPIIERTFSQKKHFEGELHFILSQNKLSTRLETRYQATHSFHSFYEDQSSDLGIKLKLLTSDIEDAAGEVMLSTKFDEQGNICSSSFSLCLPS